MKLAIYGYGNLGKGVELAIGQNSDLSLFGVFTRLEQFTAGGQVGGLQRLHQVALRVL